MPDGEQTYFERERDRLSSEIAVVSYLDAFLLDTLINSNLGV